MSELLENISKVASRSLVYGEFMSLKELADIMKVDEAALKVALFHRKSDGTTFDDGLSEYVMVGWLNDKPGIAYVFRSRE